MTASGWLAIGTVIAALTAPGLGSPIVALSSLAVALAAGVGARSRGRRDRSASTGRRVRSVVAVGIGAAAVAIRLLGAGSGPGPASEALPDGRGPWAASVEAQGSDRDGQQVATLRIRDEAGDRDWLVAATLPRYPEIEPGLIVTVDGALEAPPDGPYGDYLRRTGVAATIRSRTLAVTGAADGPGAALERLRRGAGDALAAAIPEPEAGLAAGIVIGLRDRVDRDLAADFTTVGASHVVAISGWNIAIVGATIAALAGRLGRRRRAVILSIAIVAYVLFAGASPSVVRAAAMAGVVLLARETGRAGRAAAALGWAAAILLIVEPSLVLDAGFQLSTLATGGILAWADRIDRRLRTVAGGRLPGWLAESLGVSLAAQAATLPVVLATFGRLAIISPALNLLVVPLVAPAMAAAVVALAGGAIAILGGPSIVATLAGLPAWVLLTAMCTIVRAGAALPIASVTLEPPWTVVAAAATIAVPLAVALVRRHRPRRLQPRAGRAPATTPPMRRASGGSPTLAARLAIVALAIAVGGLAMAAAHRADGATRITVLDVGQGDSILVEGGAGGRMLVDGGPDPDRLLVELDRRLPPWDRRIDILVLTHPHEDHVAGLAAPPRALPDRADVRDGDARPGTRLRAPSPAILATAHGAAGRDPRDRRPDRPRRHPVRGPVAGPGPRAARAARRRPLDQRRLDRPARRGRRPPLPAHRRRRGRRRSDPRPARPARRSTS